MYDIIRDPSYMAVALTLTTISEHFIATTPPSCALDFCLVVFVVHLNLQRD